MEILEVSPKEYAEVLKSTYHVFGSAAFNDLNKNKCDEVFYLLFKEVKFRLGIIGGIREMAFYSPFSAPFGGYSFIADDVRLQYIEEAINLLKNWAKEKSLSTISITLPPSVYGSSFIAKQLNCLWREGFNISEINLNYSFDLDSFDDNYSQLIWYNARKNLKISMNSGFNFLRCTSDEEKEIAYQVIQKNREGRGFPLRMTWLQVKDTIKIVPSDFFLVYNYQNIPVASAIVFHLNEEVVQVIYWGDLQGYSDLKPMNFLSYKVFEHYKNSGKKVVDIGPSTEHSIPNYGLCEFKEGIGCKIDPKYTLICKLN